MFLLTELQDRARAHYKKGIQDKSRTSMSYENALWANGKLDQRVIDKAVGGWRKRL